MLYKAGNRLGSHLTSTSTPESLDFLILLVCFFILYSLIGDGFIAANVTK